MGYSTSPKTLDEIRPLLVNLELGLGDLWTVPEGMKVSTFAYKIREAFYIAELYPERYPELARAAKIFKIQSVNRRQVQAVLTDKQTGYGGVQRGGGTVIQHGLEPAGSLPTKVMGKQTADTIISHVLQLQQKQPSNAPMSWPQAALSREDKLRLLKWCQKQTPAWILLISDAQVTLSRKSKDISEDVQWSPEDE